MNLVHQFLTENILFYNVLYVKLSLFFFQSNINLNKVEKETYTHYN